MDVSDAKALKEAMNRVKAKGAKMFSLTEYAGFLARLGAATSRYYEANDDWSAGVGWDISP